MLQFSGVIKQYNERRIIFVERLDLAYGIYWLQGVNGSGKTTLLRMISGLIPFSGDILLDGISLHREPLAYRRKVSWAEAEPLYPMFITGREMVDFYQDVRKSSAQRTGQLVELFGMQPYLSATIGSYSSGMIKRLSLLLAFLGDPVLILLDEPLATLDEEATLFLPQLIREYRRDRGTGFIFSSHQTFKADSMPENEKLMITRLMIADQTIHLTA